MRHPAPIAALALLLASAPAQASQLEALDRFRLGVGVFSNQLGLQGRADGSAPFDGSVRDFADALDIGDRRSIELAEIAWRPFERHEFGLRHYRDSRRQRVLLDDELRFDGQVFPFAADIEGRARFRLLELSYTGWLHASRSSALGIQLGVLRLSARLEIDASISNATIGQVQGEASVSDQLHAPLVGIAARRVFGEHLRGFVEARAISLSRGSLDGEAFSATAGIEVFPHPSLGIVLQYSDTWLEVERRSSDFNGRLEVGFNGPQAMLRWRF